MTREEMDRLIEAHLAAEKAGDPAGAVSVYVDDVEHDVVGAPGGPRHGKADAQGSTTSWSRTSARKRWCRRTRTTATTSA